MVLQFVGDKIAKIEAERGEVMERPLQIKTDMNITSVIKKELFAAGEPKPGILFGYNYGVTYGEKTGKISVHGFIMAIDNEKELSKIEKEWKDKKSINEELVLPVLNRAMELGCLTAIPVSKELDLPAPIRLPRFKKPEDSKK